MSPTNKWHSDVKAKSGIKGYTSLGILLAGFNYDNMSNYKN